MKFHAASRKKASWLGTPLVVMSISACGDADPDFSGQLDELDAAKRHLAALSRAIDSADYDLEDYVKNHSLDALVEELRTEIAKTELLLRDPRAYESKEDVDVDDFDLGVAAERSAHFATDIFEYAHDLEVAERHLNRVADLDDRLRAADAVVDEARLRALISELDALRGLYVEDAAIDDRGRITIDVPIAVEIEASRTDGYVTVDDLSLGIQQALDEVSAEASVLLDRS